MRVVIETLLAFPQGPPSSPAQPPSPPPPPALTTLAPDAGELQVEAVDDSDGGDGEEPDPAPLLILPPAPPPEPEPKEGEGMHFKQHRETEWYSHRFFTRVFHIDLSVPVEHDLRGNTGRFATPNFPDKYKDNSKINWNITVDEGQKIQLTVHLMNVRVSFPPEDSSKIT